MRRLCFIALSLVLLSGCGQSDSNALFPDLKGRWASEKGARFRLATSSTNSSAPIVPPSLKELCQNEYVTFEKSQTGSDAAP